MSRSRRKVAKYTNSILRDSDPAKGKRETSQRLRSNARDLLKLIIQDPEIALDVTFKETPTRGTNGTRDSDWGWNWFGDGPRYIWNPDDPRYEKLLRK
jgi:hypothetical protein